MSNEHSDQSGDQPLQELYNHVLLQHVKQPVGTIPISKANAEALSRNESCGDEVSVRLRVKNHTIEEVELQAEGCMICRASASLCAQTIHQKSIDKVGKLIESVHQLVAGNKDPDFKPEENIGPWDDRAYAVLRALRDYPTRHQCAFMAWDTVARALSDAIDDWEEDLA